MNFIFLASWKVANPQILFLKFVGDNEMMYFEDKTVQNDEITSILYFAYPDISPLYVENMGKKKYI